MSRCTTKRTDPDVTSRAVFAGIDYHKLFSVVSLGNAKGELLSQTKLPSDAKIVSDFFRQYAPLTCAIENCRGNEWFVELLKGCGCEVKVSNTYAVRLIADSRRKNDKIDSKILMELLAHNFLPICYQPTAEERLLRERLRWRTKLMRSRTQYKNTAHALLDKENKSASVGSVKDRKKLQEQSGLNGERQKRLQTNLKVVEFFEEKVGSEDKELALIAESHPDVIHLKTIPGVGNLSALMLIAELGDISRFKKAKYVGAYFGLVPRLYASSDVHRLGPITKQGSGLMRRILVQDAWMAVKTSPAVRAKYNAILKRRGKKVAIIAVARMLAEIAYKILKDKTTFDETKLTMG